MSQKQQTIKNPISLTGVGLHTGKPVSLTFKPGEQGKGILFVRTDLPGANPIEALVENVVDTSRATILGKNGAKVHTVEHVLAACISMGIDNVVIELTAEEPPAMDGSSAPFIEALQSAGTVEQEPERTYLEIEQTIAFHDDKNGVDVVVFPSTEFRVTYMIDYKESVVGTQYTSLYSMEEFREEFSSARTFCLLSEMMGLKESGLIQGGSLDNAVVFVDTKLSDSDLGKLAAQFNLKGNPKTDGVTLDDRPLRYPNEPVRHKVLDLVGDLALVGVPVHAHVLIARGGHTTHVELARRLRKIYETQQITKKYGSKTGRGYVFDSQAIEALLPHSYPMLLVDRILELTPMEKVVGIKNVTRNEPYFQGHFPGHPVMPGVLIIEAMGQTGGVLLLNSVDDPETKVVYFTGLENVKFRKPVIPGDQIIFTVEMKFFRRGICKMQGEARVDGVLVAEAEMTAAVIDR